MATSANLGEARSMTLPQGTLAYRERGSGQPVLFIHGVLVNADLWRNVVPAVASAGYRCIAPDWPLGSHSVAMNAESDLSPPGLAKLIADFIAALELDDVILVANDSGVALTQILMTRHPQRIAGVVLTPGDAFKRFFPPLFRYLSLTARLPGGIALLAQSLRLRFLHRLPFTFGWLTKRPVPRAAVDSYITPIRRKEIQRDAGKVLRGIDNRHTLEAAKHLPAFTPPVLLAWASEDRVFPLGDGQALVRLLPNARLETIADSYTFVSEDQPERLAKLIVGFASSL